MVRPVSKKAKGKNMTETNLAENFEQESFDTSLETLESLATEDNTTFSN